MNFLETLNDYKERGLIYNQVHPTLPLTIWNYTPETQYSGAWDSVTLSCRGLVTDDKGNVVSKGFDKFFNVEEAKHTPTSSFRVYEKADGQYIGCFIYKGDLIVNSRGSFNSPYAEKARELLLTKYPDFVTKMFKSAFAFNITYCFELIGFEQIVVSYPEPDVLFTGAFNLTKGHELEIGHHDRVWGGVDIKKVKTFDGLDWKNIKELNWQNSEGFVVRFSNGQRCKIKFEDYIKLHRQMTNLTTRSIWKALADGEPVSSILGDVPDEFYGKVHEYETNLINQFKEIEADFKIRFDFEKKVYDSILEDGGTEIQAKKMFAYNVSKFPHRAALFSMITGKDYSKYIWNIIEPEFQKL